MLEAFCSRRLFSAIWFKGRLSTCASIILNKERAINFLTFYFCILSYLQRRGNNGHRYNEDTRPHHLKKNLNASRPSEHPPVRGGKVQGSTR